MRLYPKKIRSIEDLEQEKKRLLKQARQLHKEDILSFKKQEEKPGKSEKSGSLLDLIQGGDGNPIVSLLLGLIRKKLLSNDSGKKAAKKNIEAAEAEKKSILLPIAKEFIGGYLKWKAIELSYKGIKKLVNKRKLRKEAEQFSS